jgi:hypothetical protein
LLDSAVDGSQLADGQQSCTDFSLLEDGTEVRATKLRPIRYDACAGQQLDSDVLLCGTLERISTMGFHDINYIISLPREAENAWSPLQGFSPSLLERRQWIRLILAELPPSILELFHFSDRCLQLRLAGNAPYRIVPLIAEDLRHTTLSSARPFLVVISDETTQKIVVDWSQRQTIPILHFNSDAMRRCVDGSNEI